MSELILWRHGLTDYNVAGRVQGQVDICLNETGVAQARAAAPTLAALSPSRIVSSPLERARSTAACLAALTGLPVESDEALLERSFGQWEGMSREEIRARWPDQYARWRAGEDPEGLEVETRAHTARRVGRALERLAEEQGATQDGPVVVVAHGAAITLGTMRLLGLDPGHWFGLRGLDNCHHALLRSGAREPGWTLVRWNAGGEQVAAALVSAGQPGGVQTQGLSEPSWPEPQGAAL
ncbi:histidine phosphatase family protein [Actinomyces faecalis]|uniref:histidine phosphatase family protein n=1 Tax=Actinomyces faecalis TaxID=2722820 RepID=UPI001553D5E5|nr:histidine phosphatase family protein [Actinomyces faecalis]